MNRTLALAAATLALAACPQTVHLYEDGGPPAGGGRSGKGGNGGSGGITDAGSPDGRCQQYQFTPDMPQMVIALDRSSNMNQTFPQSSTSHLSAAVHALYSDVGLYTSGHQTDRSISFWFLDFPDGDMGCSGTPECCAKEAVRTTSMSSFDMALACEMSQPCVTSNHRPVAAALANAEQAFADPGAPGSPRYVLLISDGDPGSDCSPDDCTDALQQAQKLRNDGVHLYVVSIANQSSCLFDLANAVNASTDTPYLAQPASPNDVSGDISDAISAALCRGTLSNQPSANGLDVFVGASSYGYSMSDGWTYDQSNGRLQLHGSACQLYLQFGGPVQAYAGCGPGHTSGGGGAP